MKKQLLVIAMGLGLCGSAQAADMAVSPESVLLSTDQEKKGWQEIKKHLEELLPHCNRVIVNGIKVKPGLKKAYEEICAFLESGEGRDNFNPEKLVKMQSAMKNLSKMVGFQIPIPEVDEESDSEDSD